MIQIQSTPLQGLVLGLHTTEVNCADLFATLSCDLPLYSTMKGR